MARTRGAMTAVAVAVGALALVACDTRPQMNGAEPPATTTFQFPGPELRVHVQDKGDISFEPGSEKSLEVTRHRIGGGVQRTNRLALENSDLWLDDGCRETVRGACDNRYVVKVPPKVNLVVTVVDGDARAERLDGALDLKVEHGDVRVDQAAGSLKIATRDGDVSLTGLTGPQAEASSDHGDLRVDRATGTLKLTVKDGDIFLDGLSGAQVEAKTENGDLRATFSAPPTKVDFQLAHGDARVDLPAGQERYRLDVRTDSGDLSSSVDNDATSERSVRVVAGAGDISLGRGRG
ncbi:hypothetical protein GCM10022247_19490 [Allokutzneria multivorans]|uniref:DUF4097 domain-containing protein n=1 Tax=Allokutzneria multivorans TaxID=1142134 RepID=A0ABP7RLQ9_9PSEU